VKATRVILVRHAEPHEEVHGLVYGRLDPSLSVRGVVQARELAATLASEPIAAIYSSPKRRALETAAPLGEPVVVEGLREMNFGDLEGLTTDEAAERYPGLVRWMETPSTVTFPGGESAAELRQRALAAIAEIVARHANETVAVFSHSVVIRTIIADALAMDRNALFRFEIAYGGISVVEWFDGQPFVRIVNAVRL
jgi:alpha-ribazole phosphatase/probable phosphoglycerate mutase